MDKQEMETRITSMLQAGGMKQTDIVDAFPMDQYIDVGHVLRDMEKRGLVQREKLGSTKMVTLK